MKIIQITVLLCITQLAISTANRRAHPTSPEEVETKFPSLGDGEKLSM